MIVFKLFKKKKAQPEEQKKEAEYEINPKIDILCSAVDKYKETEDGNVIGQALTDIGAKCPWGDWNDMDAFDEFMLSDKPLVFE